MTDGITIDLTNPEVKKIVDAAVAEAVGGLKSNRDTILAEKKVLEDQIKENTALFTGVDPKMVKSLLDRMKNDEETKLLAEGKIDEVFSRRTDALKKDLEGRAKAAQDLAIASDAKTKALETRIADQTIEGMVRQAASELNLIPAAIEDAIFRAKKVFQADENFLPVAKNPDGTTILGKDAKTPVSAKEWLESMKDKSPHWFPGNAGAGAGGGPRDANGKSTHTISREDARNPQKYQAAKANATKAGVSLEIVE